MPRSIRVAALQMAFEADDMTANIERVAEATALAAADGARLVVAPELFCDHYFCKTQNEAAFSNAYKAQEHPAVLAMQKLARQLGIVLPVSIFEKDGPEYYNSIVMLDRDGTALGVYRKSHIPDGPGYQEKFYFRPGNTGFKVWDTHYGKIGVGICWDQWFPEAARAMALCGAEILVYPTAIGAEPQDPALDTAARWRRAMVGHAVCNVMPVVAANRIGNEDGQIFYGTSFIADQTGEVVAEFARRDSGHISATFDLDQIEKERAAWGFFRDRRTDLYSVSD